MTEQSISVPERAAGDGASGARVSTVNSRRGRQALRPLPAGGAAGAVIATEEPAASALPDDRFLNRELSWLEFGARLLDLASDDRIPLLERVKFLAIFSEGLDEFFQVRVAGLEDQVAAGLRTRSPDGLSPHQQLEAITGRAHALVTRQSTIFAEQVAPALEAAGMVMSDWHTLDADDRAYLDDVFNRLIFPILTPLGRRSGPSLPLHLRPLAQPGGPGGEPGHRRGADRPGQGPTAAVPLRGPARRRAVRARRAGHRRPSGQHLPVDDHFRAPCLPADPQRRPLRRGGRGANLLAAVELELHRRRFGQAVRLEVSAGIATDLLDMLIAEVDVPEDSVYLFDVPIDLGGLRALTDWERTELQATPWTPVTPPRLAGGVDIFAVLAEHDILVHHPYESFAASVEAFVVHGRRRSRRPGHQTDPVPDRGRQPDGGRPGPRLPGRQTGDRRGRAAGPVRRADQHRLGPHPGGGRCAGHLWSGDPQDPLQDLTGGATRGRADPSVLPHRERQLQLGDGQALRGRRPPHRRPRHRRRRRRAVQHAHRLGAPADLPPSGGVPGLHPAPSAGRHRRGGRGRTGRAHRAQDQRAHRSRDHRRPLPGLPGRGVGGPDRPGPLLPAPGRPRAVGVDPGPVHRRPVPRALTDLPLRRSERPAPQHGHRFAPT